jgi:hypothetical protein
VLEGVFNQPGDQIALSEIASLTIERAATPGDPNVGLVLILIQVNLPNSLPGQRFAFLIIGPIAQSPSIAIGLNLGVEGDTIEPLGCFTTYQLMGREEALFLNFNPSGFELSATILPTPAPISP